MRTFASWVAVLLVLRSAAGKPLVGNPAPDFQAVAVYQVRYVNLKLCALRQSLVKLAVAVVSAGSISRGIVESLPGEVCGKLMSLGLWIHRE